MNNIPSLLAQKIDTNSNYLVLDGDKVVLEPKSSTFCGVSWKKSPKTPLDSFVSKVFTPEFNQELGNSENIDHINYLKTNITWLREKAEKHNNSLWVKIGSWLGISKKWDISNLNASLNLVDLKLNTIKADLQTKALNGIVTEIQARMGDFKSGDGALFRTTASKESLTILIQGYDNATDARSAGFFLDIHDEGFRRLLEGVSDVGLLVSLLKHSISSMSDLLVNKYKDIKANYDGPQAGVIDFKGLKDNEKVFLKQYLTLIKTVVEKDWMTRPVGTSFDHALDNFLVAEPLSTKIATDVVIDKKLPHTKEAFAAEKQWFKELVLNQDKYFPEA